MSEKEAARKRAEYARIKADPVRWEAYKAAQYERKRRHYERIKADPELYEAYLDRKRKTKRLALGNKPPPEPKPPKQKAVERPVPHLVAPEEHAHITPQMRAEMRMRQRQRAQGSPATHVPMSNFQARRSW